MLKVRAIDTDTSLKVRLKRLGDKPPARLGSVRYKTMLKEFGLPPVVPTRLVLE